MTGFFKIDARWRNVSLALIALALSGAMACKCLGLGEEGEEDEKVTLDQVPAAVKAGLLRESQGYEIKEIEKGDEDGKTTYEADLVKGTEKAEIAVDADGKLVSRETILKLDQIPAAVAAAIKKDAAGGTIGDEIEKGTEGGKTVYTATITKDGKKGEVVFGEDGSVVKREAAEEKD